MHLPFLGMLWISDFPSLELEPSQVWWHMSVIPALGRLRQEDSEFEVILGCIWGSILQPPSPPPAHKKKKDKNKTQIKFKSSWRSLKAFSPWGFAPYLYSVSAICSHPCNAHQGPPSQVLTCLLSLPRSAFLIFFWTQLFERAICHRSLSPSDFEIYF
jgi:hypothetical protein